MIEPKLVSNRRTNEQADGQRPIEYKRDIARWVEVAHPHSSQFEIDSIKGFLLFWFAEWLLTVREGTFKSRGFLYLTDRHKHITKTSIRFDLIVRFDRKHAHNVCHYSQW